jgi:hypothetical protein
MSIPTSQCQYLLTRLTALSIAVEANIRTLNTYLADPTDTSALRDYLRTSADLERLSPDFHRSAADDYFHGQEDVPSNPTHEEEIAYQAYLDSKEREHDAQYGNPHGESPERFDTSAQ